MTYRDCQVNPRTRNIVITTAKGRSYTVAFDRISTQMSNVEGMCQSCKKESRLHNVHIKLHSKGEPTIVVGICADCLVWMENGMVKGRGAGRALPGDDGPIRVDRPAAGEEAVQGTDDGGRDPPPHPSEDGEKPC